MKVHTLNEVVLNISKEGELYESAAKSHFVVCSPFF
jgi:hypothetical protein